MKNVELALVSLCAILVASEATFSPILNTENLGQLIGVQEYSKDGLIYYSFKGLRYAEPPLGPLRFKVSCSCYYSLMLHTDFERI